MPTREENSVEAKKSSYTEEDLKDAYRKGRRVGQVEGMIAYQKRLVENLQKDNASLNKKLTEVVENPYIFTDIGGQPKQKTLNQNRMKISIVSC